MTQPAEYLASVRNQYEDLPYPQRDPADEKRRLLHTGEYLPYLNHAAFQGKQNFGDTFRALVAGGGTGDSAIFLAEQLRQRGQGRVTYLDMSTASMNIAKARAAIRGLENIDWVHASLLDIPQLALGDFDYINCSGVLHHLADPDAGLKALATALKPTGAMYIMVYGTYGRLAVYQIQDLMRRICREEDEPQTKIDKTRLILNNLPRPHWYSLAHQMVGKSDEENDAGLYDMYLHSQDRSYTFPEILEWLTRCDLNLINRPGRFAFWHMYEPEIFLRTPEAQGLLEGKSEEERWCIAELLSGRIARHFFMCRHQARARAGLEDDGLIPFLYFHRKEDSAQKIAQALQPAKTRGEKLLTIQNGSHKMALPVTAFNTACLENMNNRKTVRQLQNSLVGVDNLAIEQVQEHFAALFTKLENLGWAFLRHKDVTPFVSTDIFGESQQAS